MAHEINNPLAFVSNNVAVVRARPARPDRPDRPLPPGHRGRLPYRRSSWRRRRDQRCRPRGDQPALRAAQRSRFEASGVLRFGSDRPKPPRPNQVRCVGPTRASRCPVIGHEHAAGAFMWHRRIYYHLAAHAHRAGPPPVDLVSEDGTVKALVLLLAFAATLLAGSSGSTSSTLAAPTSA